MELACSLEADEQNAELRDRYRAFAKDISDALEKLHYPALSAYQSDQLSGSPYATMITEAVNLVPFIRVPDGNYPSTAAPWPMQIASVGIAARDLANAIHEGFDLAGATRKQKTEAVTIPETDRFERLEDKILFDLIQEFSINFENRPRFKTQIGEWNVDSPAVKWCKALISIAIERIPLLLEIYWPESDQFLKNVAQFEGTTITKKLSEAYTRSRRLNKLNEAILATR